MKKLLLMFLALLTVMVGNAAGRRINIMDLPPFERAVIIIKKFETLHKPKHWPYYPKKSIIQRNYKNNAIPQQIDSKIREVSFDNISVSRTKGTTYANPNMQGSSVCLPLKRVIISSRYGVRKDPFTSKYRLHNGLDLRAKLGEPAFAVMSGVVIEVGRDGSRGNYVDIRHGRYKLSYYHLSKILVKQGQIVHPGQTVGLVGSTGRSTGAHLHLTLRRGTVSLDPLVILNYVKNKLNKSSD